MTVEVPEQKQNDSFPDWFKEVTKKLDLTRTESPRAKVLIAASYLDELTARLLKRKLVLPNSSEDPLFDKYKPLYNFGPKILLAYRIGLISTEAAWLLDKVRELRDSCAHSHESRDFDDFKDKIEEIHSRIKKEYTSSDKTVEQKFNRIFFNGCLILSGAIDSCKGLVSTPTEVVLKND